MQLTKFGNRGQLCVFHFLIYNYFSANGAFLIATWGIAPGLGPFPYRVLKVRLRPDVQHHGLLNTSAPRRYVTPSAS